MCPVFQFLYGIIVSVRQNKLINIQQIMNPLKGNEKTEFKKRLLQHAVGLIEQRMSAAAHAMEAAQAASNAEEKSSAGDKYETSRAMNHLEKEMHSRQLEANRKELAALYSIDCLGSYESVTTGCIVQTGEYFFFIAAGLGKLSFEEKNIYLLSPYAPVARQLNGKKKGDSFTFNKMESKIADIF